LTANIVMAFALFLLVMIVGWGVKKFLSTTGRRLISKTKTDLDDKILAIILPYIKWLSLIVGLFFATEQLSRAFKPAEILSHQILGYVFAAIYVAFIVVVAALIVQIVNATLKHLIEEQARRTSARMNEALLIILQRLVNIFVVLFALISVFSHFGIDVSSLLVFLGGGSVALALAAQETLSNMIAGFLIMLDRPFRVGDRIRLPSGEVGDVYEIGLRSTRVLDFDNNLIISPNADLIKTKIINYSFPEEQVRIIVDVGVAYGSDLKKVRKILLDIAKSHPDVLKEPAPDVFLIALGDSALNLQLVARTHNFRKRFLTETSLREKIYNALMEARIEIPYPQRVVHLTNPPNARLQSPQKRKTVRR